MSKNIKKITNSKRLEDVEENMANMQASITRITDLSNSIFSKLEDLSVLKTAPTKEVEVEAKATQVRQPPAQMFNYQTSAITNTVVEKSTVQPIGCFEILSAMVKQFGTGKNGLSVSAPHLKKDGKVGKSFILNMPRIDEEFSLVDKSASQAKQKDQARALWKAVAFNGYTFTGRYGKDWTTYIKQSNESEMVEFLKGEGVHIPQKDAHAVKEEESS